MPNKKYFGTEAMLRKAMEDYDSKKMVAKSENVTLGELLTMWLEEEVKPGTVCKTDGVS